jgi:protein TonB
MTATFNIIRQKIRQMDVYRLCLAISIVVHSTAYGAYYIANLPVSSDNDDKVYDAKNFKSVDVDVDFIDFPPPGILQGSVAAPVQKEEWIEGTGKNAKDAENTDVNINRISGDGTDPDGYLSSDFGDRAPTPIVDFDLNRYFPHAARSANITRKSVVVQLQINEDGSMKSVRIISPPAGYGFDEAAMKVVNKIRFRPGYVGGKPVKMFVQLPITFVLED